MSVAIDCYSEFITQNYRMFMSELENSLVKGTRINQTIIKVSFFKEVEGQWLQERYEQSNHYCKHIPADDLALYNSMKNECFSLPLEAVNNPEIVQMMSLFSSYSFDSEPMQAFLSAYRKSVEDENANPYIPLQKNIKKVFEKILRSDETVKRILKKEVVVFYYLNDDPTLHTISFEKNYDQKCAKCSAWRTTAHKLLKCSKCLETYYCNRECQRSNWPAHKISCKK